jgi:hypothetical protein
MNVGAGNATNILAKYYDNAGNVYAYGCRRRTRWDNTSKETPILRALARHLALELHLRSVARLRSQAINPLSRR